MKGWCRSTEAARILGVSVSTVQRLADAGVIPARRHQRSAWWQLDRHELERMAGDAVLVTTLTTSQHEPVTLQDSGQGGPHDED